MSRRSANHDSGYKSEKMLKAMKKKEQKVRSEILDFYHKNNLNVLLTDVMNKAVLSDEENPSLFMAEYFMKLAGTDIKTHYRKKIKRDQQVIERQKEKLEAISAEHSALEERRDELSKLLAEKTVRDSIAKKKLKRETRKRDKEENVGTLGQGKDLKAYFKEVMMSPSPTYIEHSDFEEKASSPEKLPKQQNPLDSPYLTFLESSDTAKAPSLQSELMTSTPMERKASNGISGSVALAVEANQSPVTAERVPVIVFKQEKIFSSPRVIVHAPMVSIPQTFDAPLDLSFKSSPVAKECVAINLVVSKTKIPDSAADVLAENLAEQIAGPDNSVVDMEIEEALTREQKGTTTNSADGIDEVLNLLCG